MNIHVLTENAVSYRFARHCLAEWGLSLLIEYGEYRVLLDTGHTGLWWENARQMGLDLQLTNAVVLSHRHWDHMGGMRFHQFAEKKPLYAHPMIPELISVQERTLMEQDFDCRWSDEAVSLTDGVYYLGQIPRLTGFEAGTYKDEMMDDDSALAFATAEGVVVVSGCSHAGICNICEQAKHVTDLPLRAVIGGFHLTCDDDVQVAHTLDYFRQQHGVQLFPMHCVDFDTMVRFFNVFGIRIMHTGDSIVI